jgi:recombination endonuclease VII
VPRTASQKRWREKNRDREKRVAAKYQAGKRAANPAYYKEQLRQWRKANPHKARDYGYRRNYGITLAEYVAILEQQGGVCAVCAGHETSISSRGEVKPLAVDHCHTTNKVRALLCSGCNVSIGHAGENPARLRLLADYLEKHGVQSSTD